MWLVIGAIAALAGYIVGTAKRSASPANTQQTITSGAPQRAPSARDTLALCLEHGYPFPNDLVLAAVRECVRENDLETLAHIERVFPPTPSLTEPPARMESGEITIPVSSPIRGVTDGEWSDYVRALATDDVAFNDGRTIGCFRLNVHRLQSLGIDPQSLTTRDDQYQAFETDVKDMLVRCAKLINEYAGDVITINGVNTPITRSGLLTVLKIAGPDGTRAWCSDDSERLRFPHTTQRFLSTNGIF